MIMGFKTYGGTTVLWYLKWWHTCQRIFLLKAEGHTLSNPVFRNESHMYFSFKNYNFTGNKTLEIIAQK